MDSLIPPTAANTPPLPRSLDARARVVPRDLPQLCAVFREYRPSSPGLEFRLLGGSVAELTEAGTPYPGPPEGGTPSENASAWAKRP